MIIYPAIDLKDGDCVRLLRGDMDKATVFSNSPDSQAKLFEDQGFEWLHIVDLNGAFEGYSVNKTAVKSILSTINIPAQLGGGIREISHIEQWLDAGLTRVIIGTQALRNPDFVIEACRLFPNQIAVGIDAKDGMVAVQGWAEISDVKAIDLAKKFEQAGVCAIIYTDINRDGAMQGANIEETSKLAESISTPVILSGGVSSIEDIKLAKSKEKYGISGAIIGRALYDGAIAPTEALEAA